MNDKQQLELGLNKDTTTQSARRANGKRPRAAWWFAQMRRLVDQAIDWQPAPPARPEQTWFADAHRQPQL
ncbi:MAG: hypothetical protein EPO07_10240 [Verrucomicrobia bacterium]|nr:MAG: hypothetical protein EPO07_10240 [Verrucomicrobiota bacterium]